MPCTFCDAPLPAGARYCPSCGTSVLNPSATDDAGVGWKDEREAAWGGRSATMDPPRSVAASVSTTSTLAIVSLVSGILGWSALPVIGSIVAVVAGHQARREIAESGGRLDGDGLAFVGLILGYAMVVPALIAIGFLIVALVLGLSFAGLVGFGGLVGVLMVLGLVDATLGWL